MNGEEKFFDQDLEEDEVPETKPEEEYHEMKKGTKILLWVMGILLVVAILIGATIWVGKSLQQYQENQQVYPQTEPIYQ